MVFSKEIQGKLNDSVAQQAIEVHFLMDGAPYKAQLQESVILNIRTKRTYQIRGPNVITGVARFQVGDQVQVVLNPNQSDGQPTDRSQWEWSCDPAVVKEIDAGGAYIVRYQNQGKTYQVTRLADKMRSPAKPKARNSKPRSETKMGEQEGERNHRMMYIETEEGEGSEFETKMTKQQNKVPAYQSRPPIPRSKSAPPTKKFGKPALPAEFSRTVSLQTGFPAPRESADWLSRTDSQRKSGVVAFDNSAFQMGPDGARYDEDSSSESLRGSWQDKYVHVAREAQRGGIQRDESDNSGLQVSLVDSAKAMRDMEFRDFAFELPGEAESKQDSPVTADIKSNLMVTSTLLDTPLTDSDSGDSAGLMTPKKVDNPWVDSLTTPKTTKMGDTPWTDSDSGTSSDSGATSSDSGDDVAQAYQATDDAIVEMLMNSGNNVPGKAKQSIVL